MPKDGVDPKKFAGSQKLSFDTIPLTTLVRMAGPNEDGATKYGKYNWLKVQGMDNMTYVNAIFRHLLLYMAGQDVATDSGRHHLDHIAAGIAVIRECELLGNMVDNRVKYTEEQLERLEKFITKELKV